MYLILKEIFRSVRNILKGRYKWLLILFLLWLYRVDFVVSDTGGLAKVLQVVTIFGMLMMVQSNRRSIINYTYTKTNGAVKSLMVLYTYALISTLWALIPTFAFFLSFQNLVLAILLVWIFTRIDNFKDTEKIFLIGCASIMLFEAIVFRIVRTPGVFIHCLVSGSSAALLFTYSIAEYMDMKRYDAKRKRMLKGCIFLSLTVLVTSTSSGANASAIFGLAIALLFSGRIFYALSLFVCGLVLFLNPEIIDKLLLLIMPGKTMAIIESANGRESLWNILLDLAAEKPVFGWGFACIERAVTQTGFMASDAHNNYLGIYGSLGVVGCVLFGWHLLNSVNMAFRNRAKPGYLGLLCVVCCTILNGYSYGFLSGKACSMTIIYFAAVVMMFTLSRISRYE